MISPLLTITFSLLPICPPTTAALTSPAHPDRPLQRHPFPRVSNSSTHRPPAPSSFSTSTTHDKLGAVASEAGPCTRIGIDMLLSGGNAADALTATTFCVGVVGMYHSGIGGGGFALVRAADGTTDFFDFRETAPAAAHERMYDGNVAGSLRGGLASGVPGELRGLCHLHSRHGKLPWHVVLAPAVNIARQGFVVSSDTVRYMAKAVADGPNFLVEGPTWAVDFAPNGTLLRLGDRMTRRRYADTLELIANKGPDAFYTGALANATITALRASNGTMTLADLAGYTIAIRRPYTLNYRDRYRLTSGCSPSGGAVVLSAMNVLSGYAHLAPLSARNESAFRLDEALRFAYGERALLGDPSFVAGVAAREKGMLSEAWGRERREKMGERTHPVAFYDPQGFESLETHGTSQVVAADASGLAISLTSTINTLFGSHLMVPETGIILNNAMNDFSIPSHSNAFGYIPSPANYIRPGKRPLSSMSPVIVDRLSFSDDTSSSEHSLHALLGAAGGSRIPSTVVQLLVELLDRNATARQAIAAPRLHDQLVPDTVSAEWAYDNATLAFLAERRGVHVTWVEEAGTAAMVVTRGREADGARFEAGGEVRQGAAAGLVV